MVGKRPKRRKVLQSIATIGSTTVIGASTASASTGGFRETIEHSHAVREATGSIEEWMNYLERHDVYGETKNVSYTINKGFTTQSIDKNELDINISLLEDCDTSEYYAELAWEYSGGTGEAPKDGIGIVYDSSWWKLAYDNIWDTTSVSGYVDPEEEWGFNFEGPGYSCNDYRAAKDSTQSYHHAGVYLLERDESVDSSDREIQGSYAHNWHDVNVQSVSVGYPSGVSMNVSDETYLWETKTENDGDLLRLSQADASDSHCGGISE